MKLIRVLFFVVIALGILGIGSVYLVGKHQQEWYTRSASDLDRLYEEAMDKVQLTSSTARVSLGPVLTDLNEFKSEVAAYDAHPLAVEYRDAIVTMIDASYDACIVFMGDTEADLTEEVQTVSDATSELQRVQRDLHGWPGKSIWAWGLYGLQTR